MVHQPEDDTTSQASREMERAGERGCGHTAGVQLRGTVRFSSGLDFQMWRCVPGRIGWRALGTRTDRDYPR